MAAVAWLDSQDTTVAHDNAQWLRASSGTGNVHNANQSGPYIVGWNGSAVGGPFPNGGYAVEEGFIELNTVGAPPGDGQLVLTPTADLLQDAPSANLQIAVYDWGGVPINFAAQWRTPTQLTALTVLSSVPKTTVHLAFQNATSFIMLIPSAAINRAGVSRYILYWDLLAANTQPDAVDTPSINTIFNSPNDSDLTILPQQVGGAALPGQSLQLAMQGQVRE